MRKRWRTVGLVLTLLAAAAVLVIAFPAAVYVPLGVLKREAFFAGKPSNHWARALKGEMLPGETEPEGDAGKILREGGAAAVPVLRDLAGSSDDEVRSEALLALSLMGPEAKDATPELAAALKSEKNSTRFLLASEAYASVDPASASAALGGIARDRAEDRGRRAFALAALLKSAPAGREAVPALDGLLRDADEDPPLRVEAAHVLWRMGQPAEPLVEILCDILSADECPAGVQVLEALGEMGPAARSAVPLLRRLLESPSLELTGNRWGPPHRAAVIRTLGQIGPGAADAVPALLAQIRDNYYLRLELGVALSQMGPAAAQALALRDAANSASLPLLAARPPNQLAALPFAGALRRTWVPHGTPTREAAREAILKMDPSAAKRVGAR